MLKLTAEMEETIKKKFKMKERLTAKERELVKEYGEYRFQTDEGKKKIKREIIVAAVRWLLFIPDDVSFWMAGLMWLSIIVGVFAFMIGI